MTINGVPHGVGVWYRNDSSKHVPPHFGVLDIITILGRGAKNGERAPSRSRGTRRARARSSKYRIAVSGTRATKKRHIPRDRRRRRRRRSENARWGALARVRRVGRISRTAQLACICRQNIVIRLNLEYSAFVRKSESGRHGRVFSVNLRVVGGWRAIGAVLSFLFVILPFLG